MPATPPAIKFSIVTISFDACHALSQTIGSVNAQTYPQIEHVIVDGGPGTGPSKPLESPPGAMSAGSVKPTGGLRTPSTRGPLFPPAISSVTSMPAIFLSPRMSSARTADAIARARAGADAIYFGDFFSLREGVRFRHTGSAQLADFAWRNPINHQSAFIPRTLALRYPYDRRLRLGMDYDFWLRARNEATFHKLDFPVAVFASDGRSSSAAWEIHNLMVRRLLWHVNLGIRIEAGDVAGLGWRAARLKFLSLGRALLGKRLMGWVRRRRSHAAIPGEDPVRGALRAAITPQADMTLGHP